MRASGLAAFLLLFVSLVMEDAECQYNYNEYDYGYDEPVKDDFERDDPVGCPGCPEPVTELTQDDQRIVDFAMVQLETGSENVYARKVLRVKDFKRQVVAGTKYIFTLELVDTKCAKTDQLTSCGADDIPTESCTVSVWERVWLNSTIFNDDDVQCTRHQVDQNEDKEVCKTLQSCSECLESPSCGWCKQPGYLGTRCNHHFGEIPCSPDEILDPKNTNNVVSDSPTDWQNFMRPEHVAFSLRPNKPGSIDITFVAISSGVTMLSNATRDIRVTFETSCDGSEKTERNSCSGLFNGATVVFTANIEVLRCPKDSADWKQTFEIFTESYAKSERMTVDVDMLCGCECELSGNQAEECPEPSDNCHAKTTCAQCMKEPDCAWRKSDLSSPNGNVVPNCFQNDGAIASEDILNPQGNVLATKDAPLNLTGDVFFQPQQISISLRPGQPQVIDFSWGKKQPRASMFGIEIGDNAPDFLDITYSTSCSGRFAKHERTTCPRLWMGYTKESNHPVDFQASLELVKCPVNAKDWQQRIQISPINKKSESWVDGLDEVLNIDLNLLCQECDCQKPTDKEYEENSPKCGGQGTYKCGQCDCVTGRGGTSCELDERLENGSYNPSPGCLGPLRKPLDGLWSCVNEDGMEGCQLVCPPGLVPQAGSYIHCNGTAWNQNPADFSCVMAMTLLVGGDDRSDSKYKGDTVEVAGDVCREALARVPSKQMYGHTVNVLGGKVIACGGTHSRVYTYHSSCNYLETSSKQAEDHYFLHHSSLKEKRKNHASVVVKDRLYLIGGQYSPNTTEYMSLTKNRKPEKWIIGCGEAKVTATEENLEEILDLMDEKNMAYGILTVSNGQVLGRKLGGKIEPSDEEGYFHLLEAGSDGKEKGPGYYFLTTNSAGRSSKKEKKKMGLYHETCKTFGVQQVCGGGKCPSFNRTVYMKLQTKSYSPYFLFVNSDRKWAIGSKIGKFQMRQGGRSDKPLLKYETSKWENWEYKYAGRWRDDKEITVLPEKDHGTWHRGFDLGLDVVDVCAVKTGASTFVVIGVGNDQKEIIEYNVDDGSSRKLAAQLNQGRSSHACAYFEEDDERIVVIAGGAKDGSTLNSTEILNVDSETIEMGGDLNIARKEFVMYASTVWVYASTGVNAVGAMVKETEMFDVDSKTWELSLETTRRQNAAAVGVPYAMVRGMRQGC